MLGIALWQLGLGAVCGFSVGLAKSGLPGAAIFVVPVMVLLVGDARLAAGWLLPMLCVGDAVALYHWHPHGHPPALKRLIPWVVAGMAAGAVALSGPERTLRWGVGIIIILMLGLYLLRRREMQAAGSSVHPSAYGLVTGFSSTVANAAGPVMSLYLLNMGLPKERFLGTAAWFFFILNLSKVPLYLWLGLFSRQSLLFDSLMIPPIVAGAVTGKWIANHVDQRAFEMAILAITFAATLALFR